MSDPGVVAETMHAAGFDWDAYLEGIAREDIKERLAANTQHAIERGAFGVPTFFVGEEMFFGQDRLDFVREALARD
jgi:2-hydroxychromene-2-carboxylate isomerase